MSSWMTSLADAESSPMSLLEKDNNSHRKRNSFRIGRQWKVLIGCFCCFVMMKMVWQGDWFFGSMRGQRLFPSITLPHQYSDAYPHVKLNSTLGFQKVYVLNLPKRVDRRDVMSLMALASGIDVEFFKASDAEAISQIRLPPIHLIPGLQQRGFEFTPGQLGCYRSNLDVMQHMVINKITSALIVQDDAEWDLDFKSSLETLQDPFRLLLSSLTGRSRKLDPLDPWSETDWDIFWLGASYEWPWPEPSVAPYVLYDDETAALGNISEPGGKKVFPGYGLSRGEDSPRQRIVQQSRQPLGMAAYAMTLSGAATLLSKAGASITQPYDSTICSMSRPNVAEGEGGYRSVGCVLTNATKAIGESELRSYSVWPPFVSQFRNADGVRDSDLHNNRPKGLRVEGVVGYALEIRNGVRQAILSQRWAW